MAKCKVKGCGKTHHAKGYCKTHYNNKTRPKQKIIARTKNRYGNNTSHIGKRNEKSYKSWESMIKRTKNKKSDKYKEWGGRGVSSPAKWKSYAAFKKDVGARKPGTSLERKDNSKSYSKANCKWSTAKTQAKNRRKRRS